MLLLLGALTIGLILSLLALGVFISFRIFEYSDITADGSITLGAAVTAGLFTLGKFLLGIYLGSAGVASAYGAAGSIVALVIWVYYSAQVLLVGAEFTEVYARHFGSRIEPDEHAVFVERAHPEAPRRDPSGKLVAQREH